MDTNVLHIFETGMADFPQYRKYSHERTYFKVLSEDSFEELNILGKNYSLIQFMATTFVDRNLVSDMLENRENNWINISESDYENKLNCCVANLKKT